jgi:LysR family transcriptional regulator, glycine cleavage system transcriptional activator
MRYLNRYPLAALRALEAVGRLGHLAEAAEELGVTPGAVSQHLRKVEAQLGRVLFERSARGLIPTAAGTRLLSALTGGFAEIERGLEQAEGRLGESLTVSVAPVLASKWLVPRLNQFYASNPGLQLRIEASTTLVDFDLSDVDAGVRVGKGPWPGARAERLDQLSFFPICCPALANRLSSVDELTRIPVIVDHGSPGRWPSWLKGVGRPDLQLAPGPIFSDAGLCLDAVIAGQGVALAWPTLAADALKAGLVVAPFSGRVATDEFYWLVSSARRTPSAKVRRFAAWLKATLAADCVT